MKSNKTFNTPVITVCRFTENDIITTSDPATAVTLKHLAGAYELSVADVRYDAYEKFNLEDEFAVIDHQ